MWYAHRRPRGAPGAVPTHVYYAPGGGLLNGCAGVRPFWRKPIQGPPLKIRLAQVCFYTSFFTFVAMGVGLVTASMGTDVYEAPPGMCSDPFPPLHRNYDQFGSVVLASIPFLGTMLIELAIRGSRGKTPLRDKLFLLSLLPIGEVTRATCEGTHCVPCAPLSSFEWVAALVCVLLFIAVVAISVISHPLYTSMSAVRCPPSPRSKKKFARLFQKFLGEESEDQFYDALSEPSPTSRTYYETVRRNGAYTPPSTAAGKRRAARKARDTRREERRLWAAAVAEKNQSVAAAEDWTVVEDCTSEDDFPRHVGPFLDRLDGYPYDYIGDGDLSEEDVSEEGCDLTDVRMPVTSPTPATAAPEPGPGGLLLRLRGGAGPSERTDQEEVAGCQPEAMDIDVGGCNDPVAASAPVLDSAGLALRLRGGVSRGGVGKVSKAAEKKRKQRANKNAGQADAERAANTERMRVHRADRDPSQEATEKTAAAASIRTHRAVRDADQKDADNAAVAASMRTRRAVRDADEEATEKTADAARKRTHRAERDPRQAELEKAKGTTGKRMLRDNRNASEVAADNKGASVGMKKRRGKEKLNSAIGKKTRLGGSKSKGSSSRPTVKVHRVFTVKYLYSNDPDPIYRDLSSYPKNTHGMIAMLQYHDVSGLVDEQQAEIDDLVAPTSEQKIAAVTSFRHAVGMDEQRKGCAGCGQVFRLSHLSPNTLGKPETAHLIHPAAYQTEYNGLSGLGQTARNVFPLHDNLYAVAPELVDEKTGTVRLCAPCAEKKPKNHTRFLDFDYGRPEPSLRLNPLSELNRFAIQSQVMYAVVVKMTNSNGRVESSAIRTHTFATSTDGPTRVGEGLSIGVNKGFLKHFSAVFIGSGNNFKAFRSVLRETTGSCIIPAARMDVGQTARQLTFLKAAGHPDYVDITVPPVDELGRVLQGLAEKATDDVIIEDGSLAAFAEGGMENPDDGASLLSHEPRPEANAAAAVKRVVEAVESAEVKGGVAPEKSNPVSITVDPDLSNEYASMHRIFGGVFPFEFPLGVPETFSKGGFPDHVKRRLLLCYTGLYEKLPLFNFALFSTGQRMAVNKVASSAAMSSSYSFRKFQAAFSSPQVMLDLKKATENPNGPEATRILRDIVPLIRNAGPKLPWSSAERQAEIYKIYALCQRYGLPGIFLTVSKESCTSPIVVSVGSRDLDAPMRTVWDSSTALSRLKAAKSSPATCADEYDRVCRAVLTSLCGVELESADKKKDDDAKHKVGLFGRLKALIAVNESQTRGSLHMHAILWTRFGPSFFGRFVHNGDDHEKVAAWIDEIVSATLSEATHTARKEKKGNERRDPPPFPIYPVELGDIEEDGQEVASCFNCHDHRPRCRQGKIGCRQCAAARPQSLSNATCFTQVQTFVQKPKSESTVPPNFDGTLYPIYDTEKQKYLAAAFESIDDEPDIEPAAGSALPEPDNRVLCLTLKRLCEDDQFVVEYNAVLSSMVKCNTAVIVLAAGEDARSSLMYLTKYLSKTPTKLAEVIPLLMAAKVAADRYPSTAENSGEPIRDVTYLLQKLLNKLAGLKEFSLEQCAAGNIGATSSYCSEKFTYCFACSFARAARNLAHDRAFNDDGKDGDLNLTGAVSDADTESESGSEMDVDDTESESGSVMDVDFGKGESPGSHTASERGPHTDGESGSDAAEDTEVGNRVNLHHTGSSDDSDMDTDSDDSVLDTGSDTEVGTCSVRGAAVKAARLPELVDDSDPRRLLSGLTGDDGSPAFENAEEDFDIPQPADPENASHRKPFPTSEAGGGEVLFTKDKATGKKEVKCVYQSENYYYRGTADDGPFLHMTDLEYSCLVIRKDKTLVEADQKSYAMPQKSVGVTQAGSRPRGRPSNLAVEYDDGHQFSFKSYQQLVSKSSTSILAGPPRPTAAMWHDRRTRDYFCTYYASLLIPIFPNLPDSPDVPREIGTGDYKHKSPEHYCTGNKFAKLMKEWSKPCSKGGCKLHFARYLTFVGLVTNMTSTARGRTASAIFRSKSVVPWAYLDASQQPGYGPGSFAGKGGQKFDKKGAAAADAIMAAVQQEASGETPSWVRARGAHLADVRTKLGGIESQVAPLPAPVKKPEKGKKPPVLYSNTKAPKPRSKVFTSEWHTKTVETLAEKKPGSPDEELVEPVGVGFKNTDLSAEDLELREEQKAKATHKLNEGQLDVFNLVTDSVMADEQILLIVTGDPGTGKTTVCGRFIDYLEFQKINSIALSFMWSAVYQMKLNCPRMTIHRFLRASPKTLNIASLLRDKKWNHSQWVATNMRGRDLLIIDEISTTNLDLLVSLDVILKIALDTDRPFGGVSVVLLGDFKQNKPTGGVSLATAAVHQASGKARFGIQGRSPTKEEIVEKAAAVIFVKFQRRELTEQMRAMDCEKQQGFLERFRFSSTDPPITTEILKSLPVFSKQLLWGDPLFEDAIYAVRTNMERKVFNDMQVKRFAARYKLPIFVWDQKVKVEGDRFGSTRGKEITEQGVFENRTYFTPGMPVSLSKQVPRTHESWKLKNGRQGVAHSFSYKDTDNTKLPQEAFTPEGYGKEFYIPQPDFFHVLVSDLPGEKPSTKPVIVPVPLGTDGGEGFVSYIKRFRKYNEENEAKQEALTFGVDVGFAVTFEKIQGSTLDRVILVISDLSNLRVGTFKLEKLFVAFSRVREMAHLAIFPAAARDLSYLTTMHYDDDLIMWANNYDENGFWKAETIISPTAAGLFEGISPPLLSSLESMARTGLRKLCRCFGIHYAATDRSGLLEKIRPLYARYLASRN